MGNPCLRTLNTNRSPRGRAKAWQAILGMFLACLLLFAGNPEVRTSLVELQQTAGLERMVEHEISRPGNAVNAHYIQRLDRARKRRVTAVAVHDLRSFEPTGLRTFRPAASRAPPHQPRGPPAA